MTYLHTTAPLDISVSTLKSSAVPTLINCKNPPKPDTCTRKSPAVRITTPKDNFANINELYSKELCKQSSSSSQSGSASISSASSGKRKRCEKTIDARPEKILKTKDDKPDINTALINAQLEIKKLKEEKINLNRRLKRASKKIIDLQLTALRKKIKPKDCVSDILNKLPPVPRNLFQILLKSNKKVKNWSKEKDALNLSLSVYFRSPAAYNVLRSCGFTLPHKNTLKRKFKDVLQDPGLCPKLLEILKLRCQSLEDFVKNVTISIDGMTVKEGITYKKIRIQFLDL